MSQKDLTVSWNEVPGDSDFDGNVWYFSAEKFGNNWVIHKRHGTENHWYQVDNPSTEMIHRANAEAEKLSD